MTKTTGMYTCSFYFYILPIEEAILSTILLPLFSNTLRISPHFNPIKKDINIQISTVIPLTSELVFKIGIIPIFNPMNIIDENIIANIGLYIKYNKEPKF